MDPAGLSGLVQMFGFFSLFLGNTPASAGFLSVMHVHFPVVNVYS